MVKKRWVLLVMVLICLVSVNAQTDTPFEVDSVIVPPGPPEEGTEVTDKFTVVLELKDYVTKELINDTHVNLELVDKSTNEKISTLKYVGGEGVMELRLFEGAYDFVLKVDKIDTDGRDYYIKFDQDVDGDLTRTVYLFYVGSVIGNVYGKGDNTLVGAEVKFECGGDYGETVNVMTDNFGSYNSFWLPIGSCRVSAIHGNKVDYEDIDVKKGELNNVDITLSKGVISGFDSSVALILLISVFAISILTINYIRIKQKNKVKAKGEVKKSEKKEGDKKLVSVVKGEAVKEVKREEGAPKLSSRTRDIMSTLSEKEKKVVNSVIENGNKSTQSKIRNSTGIPKTSLVRLFVSLESKKVIKVERIGKLKKIELTDWFLGKG
ncbi:MAG: hypothetical protein QF824_01575 [Candidatus Woesearchaeota archaeon]|nr:hypothetical protein [Candidatus Woesearchaeota archaeon]